MSKSLAEIRLERLGKLHNREAFDCGETSGTNYLQRVALQAQESMRAGTKVAVPPGATARIFGYFTVIAIRIVDRELPEELAKKFKIRNLASGAPALLLAQLDVDRSARGTGLGTFLLRQALHHAMVGALEVGGIALVVDALDQEVADWYQKRVPDFRPLTPSGLRLILSMRTIAGALREP